MEETKINAEGNKITSGFHFGAERYRWDFGMCSPENGWKQYDTDQDAYYFGVWVHIDDRKVFTFAEGDTTLVECPDAEHLQAELKSMADFYGDPPPAFIAIDCDDGSVTKYYDKRPS